MKDNVIFCALLPEAFARASMIYPKKDMEQGKLVRFSTDGKPGNTAGWCRIFSDGLGAVFGCHRAGTEYVWQQRDGKAPPPNKQERQAARIKFEQVRQQAELERAAQYARAAENSARILRDTFEVNPEHGYVVRKRIKPFRARQGKAGSITLPIYDAQGSLQSLQFIFPDGEKRFLSQSKIKGGRLFLGAPVNGAPIRLVEGWATGCSIFEANGETVAVCFSGRNLADVAADLRRQFPDSPLRIAGDLDAHAKGLEYAQAAAAAGAPAIIILPVFADNREHGDFNDLYQAEGLDAVRRQLNVTLDTSPGGIAPFMKPGLPTCDVRDGTHDTRPLTELGNAHRLFDSYGSRLKYVPETKSWIIWNGESSKMGDDSGARALAAELPTIIYCEGTRHIIAAEHFGRWARKSQEQRTINAAVSLLSDFALVRLPLASIDADQFTIGFNRARSVISLRNGSTRPAVPSDYITKSLGVETIGDANKAVRWVKFLEQVFNGDIELIDWIQRFCGYLLTGSTREQIFLFCFGHGANGKSVFVETLKHVMADYGRAIASETLSESKRQAGGATPDLAALMGVRLAICSETEDNTALAESLIKSLVSGDSMAVRQLYCAPVELTPNFKLVMAGNHKPIVRGNDNGIWRRVRLVPFNRTFPPQERDPNLLDKLQAEAPHILAWMVAGCISWQGRGLADTPTAIRGATDAYQVDQDITGTWLSECTSSDKFAETASGDLYSNYRAWSCDNGLKPASSTALGRRLTERGYVAGKTTDRRVWRGLRLTDSRRFIS